jgi:hypothetical protein
MQEFDLRVIKVGVEVNGRINIYQDLAIEARGSKYANANQDECEIRLSNVTKEVHDYILSQTSPFNSNATPKKIYIEAGRVSYGVTRIFTGNVVTAETTNPPDVTLILKCLTGNYLKGKVVSNGGSNLTQLSTLSQQVASDLGATLDFQATDKQVANYSFTGAALKQISKIGDAGGVNAYLDNETFIVKNANAPLNGKVTIVNEETGMIGIPETTEQGVRVKFFMDGGTTLGSMLKINSKIYPAVNGSYVIYKLDFEIANRADPFFWIAEAKRL